MDGVVDSLEVLLFAATRGERGERREGVNVVVLTWLMRAGIDLRAPFLDGMANVVWMEPARVSSERQCEGRSSQQ